MDEYWQDRVVHIYFPLAVITILCNTMACFLCDLHIRSLMEITSVCKMFVEKTHVSTTFIFLESLWHYNDNDIVWDIHCDVTMSNYIATCTYHAITMHNDIAMSFFYNVLLIMPFFISPVNSLQLFIKHKNIKAKVVWIKQEQVCGDQLWGSCSLFVGGLFHSYCGLLKCP